MADSSPSFRNPDWFFQLLPQQDPNADGTGLPRAEMELSETQGQTQRSFGYQWNRTDAYGSDAMQAHKKEWLNARFGPLTWLDSLGEMPLVLDAGCGGGVAGRVYLESVLSKIRYLGVDVSDAVDVAAQRFADYPHNAAFMQASITDLPFADGTFDAVISEGVLHHTDSTEGALKYLAKKIKPGGVFLFYVYRKKGPIREFTDDYLRDKLKDMPPEEAWEKLIPLTKLGELLGQLDLEIEIPEDIDLLEIPAGKINLQRFFYWHVAKAFYREGMPLEEMNLYNFDWYAPRNAHRQTPEQVAAWCREADLTIERQIVEEAGITVVARKQ